MDKAFIATLMLSALATVAVRSVPILLLSRFRLPSLLYQWLSFVPAAIMSALVVVGLLTQPDWTPGGWSLSACAALGSFLIGIVTRSLFLTVLSGMAVYMTMQWIFT